MAGNSPYMYKMCLKTYLIRILTQRVWNVNRGMGKQGMLYTAPQTRDVLLWKIFGDFLKFQIALSLGHQVSI